jgi:hypothetical protein
MAYPPIAQAQMAHNTLAGIAAGLLSALLFDALKIGAAGGGLILMLLSPLPVFAAGLGWGALSGTIAASVGTLVLVVLGEASLGPVGGASLGFTYALLVAVPAAIWSWQAIHRSQAAHIWRSTGALVLMVTVYGVGLLLLGALALTTGDAGADPAQSLDAVMRSAVDAMSDGSPPADRAALVAMSEVLTKLPALVLAIWLAMLTANGVLSQALLVRFDHAIRPTPMMADLGLPRWYSAVALVLLIAAFALPGRYGLIIANLLVIQSFALFLAGLAVLHASTQRLGHRLFLLIAVYAVMLLFAPLALLFAVIGWGEPWLGLKTRLGRPRSPD